nr:MAG TPA: hypothetical protein [Caudoviricetes sp.]
MKSEFAQISAPFRRYSYGIRMKCNQVNIIELLPGLRGRACVLFPPLCRM